MSLRMGQFGSGYVFPLSGRKFLKYMYLMLLELEIKLIYKVSKFKIKGVFG